jgi:hypothetical protein
VCGREGADRRTTTVVCAAPTCVKPKPMLTQVHNTETVDSPQKACSKMENVGNKQEKLL